ncbi:phosphate import ATP-binding protein PstB 1 [Rickettsiales bacterium]|nr:phosphate import ATP-binding protein PstB 1 [Rickettsiales bacterium]
MSKDNILVATDNLSVFYGNKQVLDNVTIQIPKNSITAVIGQSGCGKSTFLRCINRMNDYIAGCRTLGKIEVAGVDVRDPKVDVALLRAKVGMVFQQPNPFFKSIYDNVAYGPRIHGVKSKKKLDKIVLKSLRRVGLLEEVEERLGAPARDLSGGQQQRLCIARAIAVNPELILMDEPCSALDPVSAGVVEKLIITLKEKFTIIISTHSIPQVRRITDSTAFFCSGKLVEFGRTYDLMNSPKFKKTSAYISGG